MNPNQARRMTAFLFVALLVPVGLVPGADAWHLKDDELVPGQPPQAPEDVWSDSGNTFVDRTMGDAEEWIHIANQQTNTSYQVVRNGFNDQRSDAESRLPRLPLDLFVDGAGGRQPVHEADARRGGFGDWQVIGDPAWDHAQEAARRGLNGYTQATDGDGRYAPSTRSLMVSPEIDLDTNFFTTTASGNRQDNSAEGSTLLKVTADACAAAKAQYQLGSFGSVGSGPAQSLSCDAYSQVLGDPVYSLRFALRHNMALQAPSIGLDGVTVLVFTEPPQRILDAHGCRSSALLSIATCTVATPSNGYPVNEIRSMPAYEQNPASGISVNPRPPAPTYAGYSGSTGGWIRDTISLAPWEGRSVWVGFLFSSSTFPPTANYFQSDARFDTQTGHFGFQFDDVKVQAPAAPYNLKARTATEPSYIPESPAYQEAGIPTIPPELPFTAEGKIVNLGSETIEIGAMLRIMRQHPVTRELTPVVNGTGPLEFQIPGPQTLAPGNAVNILASVPDGLPTGNEYVVQTCAQRMDEGRFAGDTDFCEEPPAEGECSTDAWDADPCDEVTLHRFNVEPVVDWSIGSIEREDAELQVGDSTLMSLSLRNDGNLEQSVEVVPRIVTLTGRTASDSDQRMLLRANNSDEQLRPQNLDLRPGDVTRLSWDVRAVQPGQYKFMVDVLGEGAESKPFHVRDLQPEMLRPVRSWPIDGGVVPDGVVNDAVWFNNTAQEVLDGDARYRIANTVDGEEAHLYLLLESIPLPHMEFIFGEPGGGDPNDGVATGFAVNATGVYDFVFDETELEWVNTGTPSTVVAGTRTGTPGDFTYELEIPIGVLPADPGIHAGPGQQVPFLMRACDLSGLGDVFCRHYPDAAPWKDGEGMHPEDDSLQDEMAQWHVLLLSAADPGAAVFERIIGGGLGVDAPEPPILYEDFTACAEAPFYGWSAAIADDEGVNDKWNCGPYADEGGQQMVYQGIDPDDVGADGACAGECGQYSMLPGYRSLKSPPVQIPVDADKPTLTLAHQYATEIILDDNRELIYAENLPWVWLDVWNPDTTRFDEFYLLRPDGGYTTEADAGIDDPRFDREFRAHHDLVDRSESLGWWWPQGDMPLYRNTTTQLPHGGSFSGSSPWQTDTFPLYGDHFGQNLQLQGKTVRISFEHAFHAHPEVDDIGLNGRHSNIHTKGGDRVTTPQESFLASDPAAPGGVGRVFQAICRTADTFEGGQIYLLVQSPLGCGGVASFYDIILPAPGNAPGYVPSKNFFESVQFHDQFRQTTINGVSPANVPIQGKPLEALAPGTVFDWVDLDGTGEFNSGDAVYLNVGGTDRVGPGDIRIHGAASTGERYCGTPKCSPDATIATTRDLVWVDRNGDGDWDARSFSSITTCGPRTCVVHNDANDNHDMVLLPARVFDGDTTTVEVDRDWGWRLGGLAVTDTQDLRRDLEISQVRLDVPWDAEAIGVGPGTTVPVVVEVRNRGLLSSTGFVDLLGYDVKSGDLVCTTRSSNVNVIDGSSRNLTLECVIPPSAQFSKLAFRAKVTLIGSAEDALPGNNIQRASDFYDVIAYPDAGIETTVTPQADAVGTRRQFGLVVTNHGNVDLADVEVEIDVDRLTDDGPVPVVDGLKVPLVEPVLIASQALVSPRNADVSTTDLAFTPDEPGLYLVKARLVVPGDQAPRDNFALVEVKAQQVLYQNELDGDAPLQIEGLIDGGLELDPTGVWRPGSNSHDGTGRLLAGNATLGEIPANADASIRLPSVDLGAVKDATLSFRHRYNLEEGFDAARVEVSLDDGQTWSAIRPKAQPGLPDGYPTDPLIGVNALLGDEFECRACAFTGDSGDVPANSDGWITSEFDLTDQPQFQVDSALAAFGLEGLASEASPVPVVRDQNIDAPQDIQWTFLDPAKRDAGAPYWSIDDTGWFENQQYWWIDNRTYSEPAPQFGELMWWSGTAGIPAEDGSLPDQGTTLEVTLDPDQWQGYSDADEIVISFWEWRAGWRTSDRAGTGADFQIEGGPPETEIRIADMLPSGWTRREIVLPPGSDAFLAKPFSINFTYVSGDAPGAPKDQGFKREDPDYQHSHAKFKNNRGWFIDGLEVAAYSAPDPKSGVRDRWWVFDLRDLDSVDPADPDPWSVSVLPEHEPDLRWGLVPRGAAAFGSGWSIDRVQIPGKGAAAAWSFASDEYPEGYPPNADSVVVTPMVDLRNYRGDDLTFRFDHKFGFQGTAEHFHERPDSFHDKSYDAATGQWNLDTVHQVLGEAGDGGTVLYQTYDADTGEYGPWTPLIGPENVPDHPVGDGDGDGGILLGSDYAKNLQGMGYNARAVNLGSSLEQVDFAYAGDNGGFPSSGWDAAPYAPAFTGQSERLVPEGQDGWGEAAWDIRHLIGNQVRFGFHAWSAPSGKVCNFAWEYDDPLTHHDRVPSNYQLPSQCVDEYDDTAIQEFGEDGPPPWTWTWHWRLHSMLTAPEGGWQIANIAVEGTSFAGVPADLRLRVATDSSFEKGEWSVDDISIVGTRYAENLAFVTNETHILAEPGSRLEVSAALENLGIAKREGLAMDADVFFANSNTRIPAETLGLPFTKVDPNLLPEGVTGAIGPFELGAGGSGTQRIPFSLAMDLPEGTWDLNIILRYLQQPCQGCPYEFVRNEQGGAAAALWTVRVEDLLDVAFEPPRADSQGRIVTDEAVVMPETSVNFSAQIRNVGVVEPDLTATWSLVEVLRKGDSTTQAGLQSKQVRPVQHVSQPVGVLLQDQAQPLQATFDIPNAGLFEARLVLEDEGGTQFEEVLEFFAGAPEPYYRTDFSTRNASELGWRDQSPDLGSGMGGTPPALRFRQVGDQFIWGVSSQAFAAGEDYCSMGGCNSGAQDRRGPPIYGLNGHAESEQFIDLGRVPGGAAKLTIEHSHRFNELDGTRMEVLPLRMPIPENGPATPAFECVNEDQRAPLWFIPYPEREDDFGATILSLNGYTNPGGNPPPPDKDVPERRNVINERATIDNTAFAGPRTKTTEEIVSRLPAFGGASREDAVVAYDMARAPLPVCPLGFTPEYELVGSDVLAPETLINYTLQPRLRVGTLPGLTWNCEARPQGLAGNQQDPNGRTQHDPQSHCIHNGPKGVNRGRSGSMGWHISAISSNSVLVDVIPDHRVLPALDGYTKSYAFGVANHGTVPEHFQITFDPERSSPGIDETWFDFPSQMVELGAGQTKPVYFDVTVPQEPSPPRGIYQATFDVVAIHDPSLRDTIRLDIDLADQPLPDLTVQLGTDASGAIPRLEQDTTATISMTVSNIGLKDSDPVPIKATVRQNESEVPLTQMAVGRLCPATECGDAEGQSRQTLTFEWLVPHDTGTYDLRTEVDPDGRLVELSKSQNNATMRVEVVPLQRPDLSITAITLEGIGKDGYGTEGGLVRVVANVTNLGVVPATEVEVLLFSGAAELASETLEVLLPGQTQQVTASQLASRGDSLIRAFVLPTPSETDSDNNEMSRFLRVRGIDLNVTREATTAEAVAPGSTITFRTQVENQGNVVEKIALGLPDPQGWRMSASPNPVTVAAGSTGWSMVTLHVPESITAGEHVVHVQAVPQSRPAWSQDILVPLQIAADATAPSMEVLQDRTTDAGITLRLTSHSNARQTYDLVLPMHETWSAEDVAVDVPPRANATVRIPLAIPIQAAPGPTNVTVQAVDAQGLAGAAATAVIDVARHLSGDAMWTAGSWTPSDDGASRTYAYGVNVTNAGNIPFVAAAHVWGLPPESNHTDTDHAIEVEPGRTKTLTINVTTARANLLDVTGSADIFVRDHGQNVSATLATLPLPSLTMPDLELTRPRISPSVGLKVGDPAKITAHVTNIGLVASPATEIHAFVDGTLVHASDVPALAPGEEVEVNLTLAFSREGSQLLYLQSNGGAAVEELYMDNNGGAVEVDVSKSRAQKVGDWTESIPGIPAMLPVLVALAILMSRRRHGGRS